MSPIAVEARGTRRRPIVVSWRDRRDEDATVQSKKKGEERKLWELPYKRYRSYVVCGASAVG